MRKIIVYLIITILCTLPSQAKNNKLQNVFITDTSEAVETDGDVTNENVTLKGYAEYLEGTEAIYLKDDNDQLVLNIKIPQKISSKKLINTHNENFATKPLTYSKFSSEEYQIIPTGKNAVITSGGLSFGTTFDQDLDSAELEHSAGVFTAYNKGRFKFKTSYKRTIGSTYSKYSDNIYFTPEVKINNVISVKQVLSANVITKAKKSELVLSIRPFAYTKDDRLNLEIGAGQTYNDQYDVIRSRVRFSTRFKL